MILPSKHVRTERSLIGIGALLLQELCKPMTVSRLWDEVRSRRSIKSPNAVIDYRTFILALDLLFIVDAIEFEDPLIRKRGLL